MERWPIRTAVLALIALFSVAPPALADVRTETRIRVGDPYRGVALDFHDEPAVALIPATKVYYVRDRQCDLYRYGRFWYFAENGRWFRARSWQGPFIHLHSSSVPRSVRNVPLNYRRQWHGPPPRAVAHGVRSSSK